MCKERIYKTFEKMREKGRNDVARAQKNIDAGRYEDQDAFTVYNDRSDAWNRKHRDERIVQKLYLKPYFAHVRVKEPGLGGKNEDAHYFLSDCESLDSAVSVDAGMIVPFKQDKQRPITGALFSCYQRKNGKGVNYKVGDVQAEKSGHILVTIVVIAVIWFLIGNNIIGALVLFGLYILGSTFDFWR